MGKQPSDATYRIISLTPGKSTVVPQPPKRLIQTALKYTTQARYSYREAEGHYVVVRIA